MLRPPLLAQAIAYARPTAAGPDPPPSVERATQGPQPVPVPVRGGRQVERLASLDTFRGMAVAAMILVNNPGTWNEVHAPLRHAEWNGWTPTDLIFPAFLFVMGVALTLSMGQRRAGAAAGRQLYAEVTRRVLVIFALGVFLNGFPLFDWSEIRLPGVLQRVAVCYGASALIVLTVGTRAQVLITTALIAGYWGLMSLLPLPGTRTPGGFAFDANLAAYVDEALLHGHLLHDNWDPEGLLSTLPAIATALLGVLTGDWLRLARTARSRVAGLVGAGLIGAFGGLLMNRWCPINKSLWTPSYVVFTGGMALLAFVLCHWLIDLRGHRRWATPLISYGRNAIVAYVLSSLVAKELLLWQVTRADGTSIDLAHHVFERCFLPLASPMNASLLYAVAYVVLWWAVADLLRRQGVLIKI